MTLEKYLSQPIGNVCPPTKLHELTYAELCKLQVTTYSLFEDNKWFEYNPTPGVAKSTSTINWSMKLHDDSRLTEPQHSKQLHWAKVLVLVRLKVPATGGPPAPGSLGTIQSSLKWLISWMVKEGYHEPFELTSAVCDHYLNDLPSFISEVLDTEVFGESTVRVALQPLYDLWNERLALARMGIRSLSSHPFLGHGAAKIAREISTKALGWIKPLPDEVAIPLLNKTTWFLGKPAEDVIRLLDVVRDPDEGGIVIVDNGRGGTRTQLAGKGEYARRRRASVFMANFRFSTLEGDTEPWHRPLDVKTTGKTGISSDAQIKLRRLFEAVREACVITIQAMSGMRISELLGIQAGFDDVTGLPKGVRIDESSTGLYEWFVIRTVLSKTEAGLPREVDWVLGMRPKGTHELPHAIRALVILNRIYEPWRDNAKTERLILASKSGETLQTKVNKLGAMHAAKMYVAMKRFIANWVDLSGLPDESLHKSEDNDLIQWRESKGMIFRSHMLRKTWANYTLACDSRLLPAIQMQFHHLSLAMTEGGYIGKNPLLVESLSSVSRQKRNSMIFEMVTGRSAFAGRMGEQLEAATTILREAIANLPTSEKWQHVVEWANANQLQMYFSPHATCCPTRISEMRCHDTVQTPVWVRKEPNAATREPSLCAGCACAIMDKSHEPFWADRYVRNWVSIKLNQAAGVNLVDFRVIQFRANQAGSILRKFDVDLKELDVRVAKMVEETYASA